MRYRVANLGAPLPIRMGQQQPVPPANAEEAIRRLKKLESIAGPLERISSPERVQQALQLAREEAERAVRGTGAA